MIRVDLHTHSTASDGTDSPAKLVQKAAREGLAVLALTDHDTLDGLGEAGSEAEKLGIVFIRGCEISTATAWGEAHFLGLWIPEEAEKTAELEKTLVCIREKRLERNLEIVQKLQQIGFDISYEEVSALAGGAVVGRPHFAQWLCLRGIVKNRKEAFGKYLGKEGSAFVPRSLVLPEYAVALLKSTGALVSMAHPCLLHVPAKELSAFVASMKEAGLDALEAYHSEHDAGDVRLCVDLAAKYQLQLTGGSDYHGLAKKGILLGKGKGNLRIGTNVYETLLAYWKSMAHGREKDIPACVFSTCGTKK